MASKSKLFLFPLYSLEKTLLWALIAKPLISGGMNHVSEVEESFPHYITITLLMFVFLNYCYNFEMICTFVAGSPGQNRGEVYSGFINLQFSL